MSVVESVVAWKNHLKIKQFRKWLLISLMVSFLIFVSFNEKAHFFIGGIFINIGYRFQDHVDHEHFNYEKGASGLLLQLEDLVKKNKQASLVRKYFPRSVQHPKIALLTCMDARIDTVELVGDTRRSYYTVRTAGSVLEPLQQEMFEMAVEGGVQIIVLTSHTDCAAEKVANSAEYKKFIHLSAGINERQLNIKNFLSRRFISQKIHNGDLIVVETLIDTKNGNMSIHRIYNKDSLENYIGKINF